MIATTITTIALPKNKTGLFAGNTLQEVQSARNQSNIIPAISPPYRQVASGSLSLTSMEQNRLARYGSQSNYSVDGNSSTTNGVRNGFRPSTIRRQKSRVSAALTHRENTSRESKDSSLKPSFISSPASAKLKSEIDQLNSQLKIYGDINKIIGLQHTPDISSASQSGLSYSTTYRLSSASTNHTTSRIQQRYSSALTNGTLNTLLSIPGMTDTSDKSLAIPSSPFNEEDNHQREINYPITHAFQIPQQSNIGSESIFPVNSSALSTNETSSRKNTRRSKKTKPISCPFYVMYFTNLAIQQRPNDNNRVSSAISTAATRKGPVNSRVNTSFSRHQSARRQVHSPMSMNTSSTMDDDNDSLANTTSYYNNKRFSAKMAAFETENSHLLKDVLRATSWNHVQV